MSTVRWEMTEANPDRSYGGGPDGGDDEVTLPGGDVSGRVLGEADFECEGLRDTKGEAVAPLSNPGRHFDGLV